MARRRDQGLRAYRASGIVYPRLFGYVRSPSSGIIEVVEHEAATIRLILSLVADGKSVRAVKQLLDERNLRGRSGNLFQLRDISCDGKAKRHLLRQSRDTIVGALEALSRHYLR